MLSPRISLHTDWSGINWHGMLKYLDKLHEQIYRAKIIVIGEK